MLSLRLLAAIVMFVLVAPVAAADPVGVALDGEAEGDWLAVGVFGNATSHGHSFSLLGDATTDCTFTGTTLCTVFAPNGDARANGGFVLVSGEYVCVAFCVDRDTSGDNDGAVAFSTDGDANGGLVGVSLGGDAKGTLAVAPQGSASGNGVSIARDDATASGSLYVPYGIAVSTEGDARGGALAIAPHGDARGLVAGSVYGDAYGFNGVGVSVFGDVPTHCYYGYYTYCYPARLGVSVFGDAEGVNTIDQDGVVLYHTTGDCSVDGWFDIVLFVLRGCRAGRVTVASEQAAEGAWAIAVFGDANGNGCAVWGNLASSYFSPPLLPGCMVRSVAVSVFGSADGEAASVSGCDLAGLCYDELP